jgi:hypothetical protein
VAASFHGAEGHVRRRTVASTGKRQRRSFLSRGGRQRLGRPSGPRAGRWATSGPNGATGPDGMMGQFQWAGPKVGIE